VLHEGVTARENQGFALVISPPDQERRLSTLPSHLENLALFVGVADVVSLDHEMVAGLGMHRDSLRLYLQHPPCAAALVEAKDPLAETLGAGIQEDTPVGPNVT